MMPLAFSSSTGFLTKSLHHENVAATNKLCRYDFKWPRWLKGAHISGSLTMQRVIPRSLQCRRRQRLRVSRAYSFHVVCCRGQAAYGETAYSGCFEPSDPTPACNPALLSRSCHGDEAKP
jgi:hypothetical protein